MIHIVYLSKINFKDKVLNIISMTNLKQRTLKIHLNINFKSCINYCQYLNIPNIILHIYLLEGHNTKILFEFIIIKKNFFLIIPLLQDYKQALVLALKKYPVVHYEQLISDKQTLQFMIETLQIIHFKFDGSDVDYIASLNLKI